MKTIPLTQGYVAMVDDEDYDALIKYTWHAKVDSNTGIIYARRSESYSNGFMHRQIMNAPPSVLVDHRDGNGLNNVRSNLRYATQSQNAINSKLRENKTSKFRGVCWYKNYRKWMARLSGVFIGYFDSEEEAAKAYDKAAKELFGEFATLNFP